MLFAPLSFRTISGLEYPFRVGIPEDYAQGDVSVPAGYGPTANFLFEWGARGRR